MTSRTYYIDPAAGSDANDGLSPSQPVNNCADLDIRPGDRALFKRGRVIRGLLHTREGRAGAPVTYGAYGDGEAPAFLGSVAVGDPAKWTEERPSIWRFTGALTSEVCNLVFNGGESCGILRWEVEDLQNPGDWHYTGIGATSGRESRGLTDTGEGVLYLCAPENPGHAYRDIEAVLWGQRKLVGGRRHLVLENLSFRNSGVHGFHDCEVGDVTIRDCDFRHIGGAVWHREHRIRFGNAVELWDGACEVTVEGCRFENIYDSGVTHQGGETRNIPERVHFRNNLFIDCGLAAYECREPSREIYFEHNTCIRGGGGFSMQGETPPRSSDPYLQPVGYHVMIWMIDAGTQPGKVYIRHNLFCESYGAAVSAILDPADEDQFAIDHNAYWQTIGEPLIQVARLEPGRAWREAVASMLVTGKLPIQGDGRSYAASEFSRYQAESGQDQHSRFATPLFINAPSGDFRQRPESPCGEMGMRTDDGT